jgi:hypothetical protein
MWKCKHRVYTDYIRVYGTRIDRWKSERKRRLRCELENIINKDIKETLWECELDSWWPSQVIVHGNELPPSIQSGDVWNGWKSISFSRRTPPYVFISSNHAIHPLVPSIFRWLFRYFAIFLLSVFGVKIRVCVRATSERGALLVEPPKMSSWIGTPSKCLFFLTNRNGFSFTIRK